MQSYRAVVAIATLSYNPESLEKMPTEKPKQKKQKTNKNNHRMMRALECLEIGIASTSINFK